MSEPEDHPDDPHVPAEALPPPREKAMGFWEHLEELRGTIIKSVVVFVVFAGLIGYFFKDFYDILLWPLTNTTKQYPSLVIELGTTTMMEVFNLIIQMCLFGGLTLSSPFILFFIAQFVAPALTEKEMKAVLPLCISAMALFLIGAAFSFFFLVPSMIRVVIELNTTLELAFRWTVGDYFSKLIWFVFGVGATFEFPLVIILLVWLGVMTTEFLRKYRRHAIVLIFIIAAVVTPTSDPLTLTLLAAPLYALFELAVIISSRVEKRKKRNSGM